MIVIFISTVKTLDKSLRSALILQKLSVFPCFMISKSHSSVYMVSKARVIHSIFLGLCGQIRLGKIEGLHKKL
jgi:hypothetical protein